MAWRSDGTPRGYWTERRGDLLVEMVTSTDHAAFDAFHAVYDKVFSAPSEKEDVAGFERYFALNSGPSREALVERYGRFAGVMVLVHDARTRRMVGGAVATLLPCGEAMTIGLDYFFTAPEVRGMGYARPILEAVRAVAEPMFPGRAAAAPVVLEIEDPFRIAAATGSDDGAQERIDRLLAWSRLGARALDVDYVQPALGPGKEDDAGMMLCAIMPDETMPARLLADHLERYFAVSILKGDDPMSNDLARSQVEALRSLPVDESVAARDMSMLLPMLAAAGELWGGPWDRLPVSMREALGMTRIEPSP